jgi:hypothetical protein
MIRGLFVLGDRLYYQPETAITLMKAKTANATKLNPIANLFFFLALNNLRNPIAITIVKIITKGSKNEKELAFAAASAAYNIERPPLRISYNCPFYLYVSLIGLCLQVIGMMCNKFVTFSYKSVSFTVYLSYDSINHFLKYLSLGSYKLTSCPAMSALVVYNIIYERMNQHELHLHWIRPRPNSRTSRL